MSRSKKAFVAGVSLVLVLIVVSGCLPNKKGGFSCIAAPLLSKIQSLLPSVKKNTTTTAASTGPTRPHPPVRTGTITTGAKTQVASQSIDSSGGIIAVDKPGDPLDGFVIDVPAKSYSDGHTFKISSAPITKQTFGNDINPVSPMITVDNVGGFADEIMYIRIPVKVPEGKFAMGFIYDEKSGHLEGLPLVGRDADSITVATCHFCDLFASMIDAALLKKNIDSGFCPGIDDWQFGNYGSYITPLGECSGQSIAAMWYYYTQPDGNNACLYGRYDNNGNQPETPKLWQDDSLGYRFCCTIHKDQVEHGAAAEKKWEALAGVGWIKENNHWKRIEIPGISNESEWRLFAYSIQASHQPQLVRIDNADVGHAMICFAVCDNGTLRVADPNYPGREDRVIEFVDNKFKPYNSGANKADIDAGKGIAFDKIVYEGAWTIVPYDKIAGRWTEFKNKTIGNDRFPICRVQYKDDKGQYHDVPDGFVSPTRLLDLYPETNPHEGGFAFTQYRDGVWLKLDINGMTELKPGNNRLGFYFNNEVHKVDANGNPYIDKEYIDFKYMNIVFNGLTIDPATLDGEPNKQYTFTAKADSPPAGARFDWYADGSKTQSNTSTSYAASFKSEGSHKVSVKLVDSAGKEMQETEAAVTIKAAATGGSGGLAELQKTTFFRADMICDKFLYNELTGPETRSGEPSIPDAGDFMSIKWNGASFSGNSVNKPQDNGIHTVKGTVSPDGKTLLSVEYTYSAHVGNYANYHHLKLQNVPIGPWIQDNPQKYIVMIEQHDIVSINGQVKRETTMQSPPIKDYSVFKLQCIFR